MDTQETHRPLLSHTLKEEIVMSAYGSFKRKTSNSSKGQLTGINLSKKSRTYERILQILKPFSTIPRRWSKRNARDDIEFEEVPRSRTAQIYDAGTGKTQFWR